MILVPIDMPKNCHECLFNHGEYGPDYYEKCSCMIIHHYMRKIDYKRRPKDCPLKKADE